jgi:DNA-binding Lrp family transcriptional regulator
MSLEAILWALRDVKDVTPTQKLILIGLGNHVGPDGSCWPSQTLIAEYTGLSREAIYRNLSELERRGIIRSIRNKDNAGRDVSKTYILPVRSEPESKNMARMRGETESLTGMSKRQGGEMESLTMKNQDVVREIPAKVPNILGETESLTGGGSKSQGGDSESQGGETQSLTESKEEKLSKETKDLNTSAANEKIRPPHDATQGKTLSIDFDFSTGAFSNITEKHLRIWSKAYPAVDIATELQRMAAWLIANPTNRKSNYARFITNWLTRAQDRSPLRSSSGGPLKNSQKTFAELREENNRKAVNSFLKKMGEQPLFEEGEQKNVVDAK